MKEKLSNIFPRMTGMASILAMLLLILLPSCHDIPEFDNDPYRNFDCLANLIADHYCFLQEKDIDWTETVAAYRKRIIPDISNEEFFNLCAEMLAELKDGHVNLASPFDVSYYRNWWTDYPQDFNLRTLQQFYLDFDYKTTCGVLYKILPENIGYIYYPSFNYDIGEGNLDYILSYLSCCNALIIDIRDNGGGSLTNIDKFVGRLVHSPYTGAYICHKTGPLSNSFSDPYPIVYTPADPDKHICWDGPVAVLTNRSTFSAANTFAAVTKALDNVTVIGARTGGGGGMPFTYSLPNGWRLRLSASPISDSLGNSIEQGIDPSPGFELHSYDSELAKGHDAILDRAIEYLSSIPAIPN